MKQRNKRGLLGALGATLAAGALALTGTVAAHANTDLPTIPPPDADQKGNLTITKYDIADGVPGGPATGQSITQPDGTEPLADVTFKICKVDSIDLATNAGWVEAQDADLRFDAGGANPKVYAAVGSDNQLGCSDPASPHEASKTTGPTGVVKWEGLPIGLYMVQETDAPEEYAKSAPFMVTIPITDPTALDAWDYDVHVYPKNYKATLDKKVDDYGTAGIGFPYTLGTNPSQQIKFTLTSDVPRIPNPGGVGGPFAEPESYVITDTLDSAFPLTKESGDTVYPTVSVGEQELTKVSSCLAEGETGYGTATSDGYTSTEAFVITFCKGGLAELQTAAAKAEESDRQVTVEFTVDVEQSASGVLTNEATIEINGDDTMKLVDTVNTRWGALDFTKAFAGGDAKDLQSDFKLYLTRASAEKGDDSNAIRGGDTPVKSVTGEVDDKGEVSFPGLRASNFADGEMQQPGESDGDKCTVNPNYLVYWVTETKAPEGYELLVKPIPVAVEVDGDGEITLTKLKTDPTSGDPVWATPTPGDGEACAYQADGSLDTVTNVQKNAGFNLPLTGGWGTVWLMVAGGALLAIVLMVARRRRAEEV